MGATKQGQIEDADREWRARIAEARESAARFFCVPAEKLTDMDVEAYIEAQQSDSWDD